MSEPGRLIQKDLFPVWANLSRRCSNTQAHSSDEGEFGVGISTV